MRKVGRSFGLNRLFSGAGSTDGQEHGEASEPMPGVAEQEVEIRGQFDGLSAGKFLSGWVHYIPYIGQKVELDIIVDGVVVQEIIADQYREDLHGAGIDDPSCGFYVALPAAVTPDQTHSVSISLRGTGRTLHGSPVSVFVPSPPAPTETIAAKNFVKNATFARWPRGVEMVVTDQASETARDWHVIKAAAYSAPVKVSLDKIVGSSQSGAPFALRIEVDEASPARAVRLACAIDSDWVQERQVSFSCTFVRDPHRSGDQVQINEIYIGELLRSETWEIGRLSSIVRFLAPNRNLSIANRPVPDKFDALVADRQKRKFFLVMEISGRGSLTISRPTLGSDVPSPLVPLQKEGYFEDPRVQQQWDRMVPGVLADTRLSTALVAGMPVVREPEHKSPSHLPFTQIVVPIYNAVGDVEECVASVLKHTSSPFELLLIDDASEPYDQGRLREIAAGDPRIRLVVNDSNLGYTKNVNKGLRLATAAYVVVLNSDTVVTAGWLDNMFAGLFVSADTVGCGPLSNAASYQSMPRLKSRSGDWEVNGLHGRLTPDLIGQAVAELSQSVYPVFPLLNGFCTLFKRAALEEVGFLDDASFPAGFGEENDLCLRLGEKGGVLRVADNAYVFHKKSRSFGHSTRRTLSAGSNEVLRSKHPDVNLGDVEQVMASEPTLKALRAKLTERLGVPDSPAEGVSGAGE